VTAATPRARATGRALVVPAACGGVLYFLGYLGWGLWPCLLVFLVPLWCSIEAPGTGVTAAVVAGFAFGLAAYAGGFLWLWRLVAVFLEGNRVLGVALFVAYGVWFALGFAVYAVAFRAVRRRGWSVAVAGIPPLIVVEWLQPQLFPVYAGAGLLAVPAWAQAADLGGPLLLTALVGVGNVAAFESWAWWSGRRVRPLAVWAAALAVALAVPAYGRVREAAVAAAAASSPALRVGIVQANLDVLEKEALSRVTHRRHLELSRELLRAGEVDLLVWPETAYVRGIRGPLPVSGRPIVEDVAVPLLFGGTAVEERDGRRRKSNSAFLVGADGMIRDAYAKNLLIPLAERLPVVGDVEAVARWLPHVEEFRAASDTPALHLGSWRIVTPICYEIVRPDFVRRMIGATHPHLVVTLANDAWFGDSQEPWLHLALARLRAIEHRRFVVRATNSGVSAIIDPTGRLIAHTALLTRATLHGTVALLDTVTPYTRVGDWPAWIATLLLATSLVRHAPRSREDA
jgi:apolipoprotein N-acyltransferase